jgi:hypothetical protein
MPLPPPPTTTSTTTAASTHTKPKRISRKSTSSRIYRRSLEPSTIKCKVAGTGGSMSFNTRKWCGLGGCRSRRTQRGLSRVRYAALGF